MRTQVAFAILSLPSLVLGTGCYKVIDNTVPDSGMMMMMMPPVDSGPAMAYAAKTVIRDRQTLLIGHATFTELMDGRVEVTLELSHTSTGAHGVHIHANGSCDLPDFATAGG